MSDIKVWGHPRSINVQKVLWALDEVGLPYERIDAGATFGQVKTPAYLALNPNGLIPTLQDGDASIWESNAILRYVFAKYGKAPVQPLDLLERTRADQWTEWFSSTFWPPTRVLLVQLVRTAEEQRSRAAIDAAREQVTGALALLDAQLARTPYVAGANFTWGDIPLAAATQRWFNLPLERPQHAHVSAWYARVKERAGFKRWIDVPLA